MSNADGPGAAFAAGEESQVSRNWLRRMRDIADRQQRNLFREAMRVAGLELDILDGQGEIATPQFDIVQDILRRDIPDIVLQLHDSTDLLDLGLLGYATASCGTLGPAFDIVLRFHSLTTDQYDVLLEADADMVCLRPVPRVHFIDNLQSISEECFGGFSRLIRQLLGAMVDYRKMSCHFDYAAPGHVDSYYRYLNNNCIFQAEITQMRFPRAWFELPIETSNPVLEGVCASMCERLLVGSHKSGDTLDAVQRLLISRPSRSILGLEEAALELNLSVSQLRKRLYRVGTSYKQVVLQVRMELARHYLETSHLTIQEIAYLLDYSQAAPLSRAFKKYFGESPEQWRRRGSG